MFYYYLVERLKTKQKYKIHNISDIILRRTNVEPGDLRRTESSKHKHTAQTSSRHVHVNKHYVSPIASP